MRIATDQNNPTVHNIIDLGRRILKLSGKLDSGSMNLVYKTTTIITVGNTMLRSYPTGRFEVRRRSGSRSLCNNSINCWTLALSAHDGLIESYDPDDIDTIVVQLRRILILESLANL